MISKSLASGLISLLALLTITLANNKANADEPLCYMLTSDGRTVDLTKMCTRKPKNALTSNENQTTSSSSVSIDPEQALQDTLRQLNAQDPLYGNPAANSDTPLTQVISQ